MSSFRDDPVRLVFRWRESKVGRSLPCSVAENRGPRASLGHPLIGTQGPASQHSTRWGQTGRQRLAPRVRSQVYRV